MKIKFDYSSLRGEIVRLFGTISNFCEQNDISNKNMSAKLNNKAGFSQRDIIQIKGILNIPDTELGKYFFTILEQ